MKRTAIILAAALLAACAPVPPEPNFQDHFGTASLCSKQAYHGLYANGLTAAEQSGQMALCFNEYQTYQEAKAAIPSFEIQVYWINAGERVSFHYQHTQEEG